MSIFTPADEVKVERQLTGQYTLDINLWAGGKPVKIYAAELYSVGWEKPK
jgi:hypothetical protein